MKNLSNEKGIAFAGMLVFFIVLSIISAIFVAQTIHETRTVRAERETTAAFFAAHAGSQAALAQLDTLINTFLQDTIAASTPSGVINFATSQVAAGDGVGWLVYVVRDNNNPVLTQNGQQAEFSGVGTLDTGSFSYLITMTEKGDPYAVGTDSWDFPFSFEVSAAGATSGSAGDVLINGDFTVRLQKDNFAKFALFTNEQEMQNGTNVWFTDKTNFFGPVHTNERFNFALNPSGSFTDEISEFEQTARFYNGGSPVLLDAEFNGTNDVPIFYDSFTRGASQISFTGSTTESDIANQASGGQVISSNGIYVPESGGNLIGGIYVDGDATISISTDASDNAVYTVSQGGTTKEITVDRVLNQTTVENLSTSTSNTYSGLPDGIEDAGTVIHVTGDVAALSGNIQQDTEVTISSSYHIMITDHLRYSDYDAGTGTPGQPGYVPPSADNADNLLGLISWNGNVRVGTSAPDDVDIHSTIMAQTGVLQVDNYNDQGVGGRGTATLLGGVITDNYGAFGLFNGSTGQQVAGYGRNFVYDHRMLSGKAPPYFPTLNTFIAFTNDITDKLVWQEGQ